MTPPRTPFRPEALDSWARGRDRSGGVVRLGSRGRTWLYRLTMLLVLAGLAALWLVRVQEQATGPAVVDERTGSVTALLPSASAADLVHSPGLRVDVPGDGQGPVPVSGVHADQADQADDATVRAAGLRPLAQPGILLTGRLREERPPAAAAPDRSVPATASAVLRSERLVGLVARQFRSLVGQEGPQ